MSRFSCKRVNHGHIQLIFGPMFSGKTTEMLRRINRYRLANRNCCVIKYKRDTRYDNDKVATHDLQVHDALSAVKILEVWDQLMDAQVIGIDEGQFFDDVVECSENLANLGKVVIVAALDGDFNRKRFKNNIVGLCSLSECLTKLTAVCTNCGEDAAFTFRKTTNIKQEVIGGKEMYTALCRTCYYGASKSTNRSGSALASVDTVRGRIELILGPMFSGKTTELLRRRNRHALAGRECKVVKYADGHHIYPDKIFTHDELVHEALTAKRLEDVVNELLSCEVVLIDDGQFFLDAVEVSERLANLGKTVIISALDGDYNRQEFTNGILNLCPFSEAVTKLCAVCSSCDNDAAFSKKISRPVEPEATNEKKRLYRAMCRTCYMEGSKQAMPLLHHGRSLLKNCNIERKRLDIVDDDDDSEAAKRLRLSDGAIINVPLKT